MPAKLPWAAIRIAWTESYVSTRQLCRELGIDRSTIVDRIRDDGWKAENFLTLAQMQNRATKAQQAGDHARAAEIELNIRMRRSQWKFAAVLLRAVIAEARGAR